MNKNAKHSPFPKKCAPQAPKFFHNFCILEKYFRGSGFPRGGGSIELLQGGVYKFDPQEGGKSSPYPTPCPCMLIGKNKLVYQILYVGGHKWFEIDLDLDCDCDSKI